MSNISRLGKETHSICFATTSYGNLDSCLYTNCCFLAKYPPKCSRLVKPFKSLFNMQACQLQNLFIATFTVTGQNSLPKGWLMVNLNCPLILQGLLYQPLKFPVDQLHFLKILSRSTTTLPLAVNYFRLSPSYFSIFYLTLRSKVQHSSVFSRFCVD